MKSEPHEPEKGARKRGRIMGFGVDERDMRMI
jgi:hypothetical protein